MAKVFLSHAGEDAWIATQIATRITQVGADFFLFETGIESGDAIARRIREQMETSTELLVLFTPHSLQRPYVWIEVGAALMRDIRMTGIVYGMPVRDFLAGPGIPGFFHDRNMRDLNDLERYVDELARRVQNESRA